MIRVGFVVFQGYLCEACHTYNRKDGKLKKVVEISEKGKHMLFEYHLTFAKPEKKKRARKKTTKTI